MNTGLDDRAPDRLFVSTGRLAQPELIGVVGPKAERNRLRTRAQLVRRSTLRA
jgi:hypothetical protein